MLSGLELIWDHKQSLELRIAKLIAMLEKVCRLVRIEARRNRRPMALGLSC
jgi:hypothetical protein